MTSIERPDTRRHTALTAALLRAAVGLVVVVVLVVLATGCGLPLP